MTTIMESGYDYSWDDDERSLKMVNFNYNIVHVEPKFIPITQILKEMYEEDRELLYCDSDRSYRTYESYDSFEDYTDSEYDETDENDYNSDVPSDSDEDKSQNENIANFMYNKFAYL